MKRFLLTVLPIALLSACGSVSYNNGGTTPTNPGTTPGSGTTPDPGTGGTTPTPGTILDSKDYGNLHFDFLGCRRFSDPTANVVCDFDFINSGDDRRWDMYYRRGKTRLIATDGVEYLVVAAKGNTYNDWVADYDYFTFLSQIKYRFMYKFTIPQNIAKMQYLDIEVGNYVFRFKDVAIK